MSIEIHCPSCSKLIRAPEDAGGKRGKCPYCKNSVYIPMPADEDDVIPVAPIDTDDERRAEELRQEALRYAASLDKEVKPRGGPSPGAGPGGAAPPPRDGPRAVPAPGEVIDIAGAVEQYVLAMRDSKLKTAQEAVGGLKEAGTRARDYVQGLLLDEVPPTFQDVPPPLMKGVLKKLLHELS